MELGYGENISRKRRRANCDVDEFDTKRAALGISASVVSLISYSRNKLFFAGSGTIVECEKAGSSFWGTILTSATLLRSRRRVNSIEEKIRVIARLPNGKRYKGHVIACDFHYNIAAIKIGSRTPFPTANLRCLDDSIPVHPSLTCSPQQNSSQPGPSSNLFRFSPEERAILMARYYVEPYQLLDAPAVFSFDSCKHDCTELFVANCRSSKCCIGGPLVNKQGEVIGIAFYGIDSTPFLPSNVVCKWWDHFKKFEAYHRPWLGIQMTNLYAAKVHVLEEIFSKFPNISQGILVEGVLPESPADRAGICPNDFIVKCGGNNVQSLLQFFEMLWDKVGVPVELVVLRARDGKNQHLYITADEVRPDQFNCWSLPQKPVKYKRRGRRVAV